MTATPSIMALAQPDGWLRFVARKKNGTVLRRGRFSQGAPPATTVVVADFGILALPDLKSSSLSGRIGLLPPDPDLDCDRVADEWTRASERNRVHLRLSDLEDLRSFIKERVETAEYLGQCLERATSLLLTASPEYYDILSVEGQLIPDVLPLLRNYPTPQHLQAAGPIQLGHALRTAMPGGRQQLVDRLLQLRQAAAAAPLSMPRTAELTSMLLPSTIDHYLLLKSQRDEIDEYIYLQAGGSPARRSTAVTPQEFSLLNLKASTSPSSRTAEPATLHDRAEILLERRSSRERQPVSDYQEYQGIRALWNRSPSSHDYVEAVRLETIGQLLALSAGNYIDAIRYRTNCEELLSDPAAREKVDASEGVRSDAVLSMAITEVCAVGVVEGLPALRNAIETESESTAAPALLVEARGLFALALALFGEHGSYPTALDMMRALADEHETPSASRAPASLTDLFIESIRPETPPERLRDLHRTADEQSRDTHYRSFFHYIVMLASYVSKDTETAILSYSELCRDGSWERYSSRFFRLARLAHAMLLASSGDFAASRKELAIVRDTSPNFVGGAEHLIRAFTSLRLDLAGGEHAEVLTQTAADGPLGEHSLVGVQMRRYVPLSLILQGTALMREGSTDLAEACFYRATRFAVVSGEWLTALASETSEYRAWLASLDQDALPDGLTQETYAAILSKPIFISHTLPKLTAQQTRVLGLLADGRSIQSIGAELHISANTMKTHLRNLYERLGVASRDQAVQYASAYGLLG